MLRLARPLALLVLSLPHVSANEIDDALRDIKAVKKEGAGSAAARKAWDKLVRQGPKALPRILYAMDTPDTVVANWLRTAFDAIAEPELRAGGKRIDAEALLAFAKDGKRQGRARRLALEVVEQLRPGTTRRLLAGWLNDPEFGADVIDQRLTELPRDKALSKAQKITAYREVFAAARDLAQARTAAARLKELGVSVSVADHFGFLRDWYVIGPFGGRKGKGFKAVYPPERKVDLGAALDGKGKKVRWQRFTVAETVAGRFPALIDLRQPLGDAEDAVAYAYTTLKVASARTVEFRGSADDNLTVWVNGERVFGFEEYRNGVRLDRHRFRVKLRGGVNTVLVKVCQAPFDANSPEPNWEFLLRITDLEGKGVVYPSGLPHPPTPSPKAGEGEPERCRSE
jgi:hypothetical protein